MSNLNKLGWQGKAGLILPSVNTVTEAVLYALAPQGVSFHSSRTLRTGATLEDLEAMEKQKDKAVRELASAELDCIADCCTAGGVARGLEADKAFCERVERDTGIRTTSTIQAILEALKVLGIHNLVLTSPYPVDMDEREKAFLGKQGFGVINMRGLGIREGCALAQVSAREIYRLCVDTWDNRADGLLISCMNFNAIPVIYALELALKVPVVTSVSATLWKILQILGVEESILGYGRLLEEHIQVK